MKESQTDRLERYLRAHPGASGLEIVYALQMPKYTGRVSDLRARGLVVACEKRPDNRDGYRIVEPEPVQVALFFSETA